MFVTTDVDLNLFFTLVQLKDFKRAEQAIEAFIAIQSMTTLPSSELKKKMDTTDILSYPLLQWYVIRKRNFFKNTTGKEICYVAPFWKVGH